MNNLETNRQRGKPEKSSVVKKFLKAARKKEFHFQVAHLIVSSLLLAFELHHLANR
jgi:hypothetical protein